MNSKKSLLKKIVELFAADKRGRFGRNISAEKALLIQEACASSGCDETKLPDQPYVEITKQLTSNKAEIFAAALYYLEKIAANKPQNRQAIVDLLQSISQEGKISVHNKSLILNAIKNISDFN